MKNQQFLADVLLITAVLSVRGTSGYLTTTPVNSAVNVGSGVTFTCASSGSSYITWIKTLHGNHLNSPREQLTDSYCNINSQYANYFGTVRPYTYSCSLILSNALVSHGGFYSCVESSYPSYYYSHSVLIVIDSSRTGITSNRSEEIVHGEVLRMENTIGYGGPRPNSNGQLVLPPAFKWALQSNLNNALPSSNAATWNTSSSYYTITAQQAIVPSYVCTLFFSSISAPASCATNLPTYTLTWTIPQSPVYYMNRPSIEQTQYIEPSEKCEASILRCIPSAHPLPTVQWTDTKTLEVFNSDSITAELSGTYKCTTRNTIRGEQRTESTTYTVTFNSCPRTPCKFASSDAVELILPDGSSCDGDSCFSPFCSAFTLRCKVAANPSAHYRWLYGGGGGGEEVEGDTVKADKDGNYTCYAYTAVNGRISKATRSVIISRHYVPESNVSSVTVSNRIESSDSVASIVLGVTLGISVVINIVLGALLVTQHLRHKPASSREESNDGAQYEQTNIPATTTVPQPSNYYEALRGERLYANTPEQRYQTPIKLNRQR